MMAGSMDRNSEFSRVSLNHNNHEHVGNHPPNLGPLTQKLDFNDVMHRLQSMFPLDSEVIEAVLRAQNGDVDAAVNALLLMCDDKGSNIHRREFQEDVLVNDSVTTLGSNSIFSHQRPPIQPRMGAAAAISASTRSPSKDQSDIRTLDLVASTEQSSSRSLPSVPGNSQVTSSGYRSWNPPLLGTLPDDFLRLGPPHSSNSPGRYPPRRSNSSGRPSGASLCSSCGRQHSGSFPVQRSSSHRAPSTATGGGSVVSHWSSSGAASLAMVPVNSHQLEHQHSLPTRQQSISGHTTQCRNPRHFHPPPLHSNGAPALQQHNANMGRVGDILQKRLEANAELMRRVSLCGETDRDVLQYLDDERIAIMLQNEEFLKMLRHDEDFMRSLQRDRQQINQNQSNESNAQHSTAKSEHEMSLAERIDRPIERDHLSDMDGFPAYEGDDEELRKLRNQLKEMGHSTKKKFAALAKRFFSVRYKKKASQLPFYKTDLPTESTMNLLEDDETDQETRLTRQRVEQEQRILEEQVEFEPWPTTLPVGHSHSPNSDQPSIATAKE